MNLFEFVHRLIIIIAMIIGANEGNLAFGSTDVLQIVGSYDQFFKMPVDLTALINKNDTDKIDPMIVRCYNTICRDWMHECHWYCDLGKSSRCMECLSWRGEHCYPCFKLL